MKWLYKRVLDDAAVAEPRMLSGGRESFLSSKLDTLSNILLGTTLCIVKMSVLRVSFVPRIKSGRSETRYIRIQRCHVNPRPESLLSSSGFYGLISRIAYCQLRVRLVPLALQLVWITVSNCKVSRLRLAFPTGRSPSRRNSPSSERSLTPP